MSRLTRDGTAELVSRDLSSRARMETENVRFSYCLADHKQDRMVLPLLLLKDMTTTNLRCRTKIPFSFVLESMYSTPRFTLRMLFSTL